MKCNKCGSHIDDNDKFCRQCGAKIKGLTQFDNKNAEIRGLVEDIYSLLPKLSDETSRTCWNYYFDMSIANLSRRINNRKPKEFIKNSNIKTQDDYYNIMILTLNAIKKYISQKEQENAE